MAKDITDKTRWELVRVLRGRYRAGSREEKSRILAEFVSISGYHCKSAIRILNEPSDLKERGPRRSRPPVYDEAVLQALIVLWEASDRVCGKRLKALLPVLLPALERHGHLQLDPAVRAKLMAISAAPIDRRLQDAHSASPRRRVKRKPPALRQSIPIRTFADWAEPPPGYMEMDWVVHCG